MCSVPTPREADDTFIKRVVAGPGDTLAMKDGVPIVNGEPFTGDFQTKSCRGNAVCDYPKQMTIGPDLYFMLGDNRPASGDSRFWGPVPIDWIEGRVD